MVAEKVPERPLIVVVSLVGGDVYLEWSLERSSGWIGFIVAAQICCCYYQCLTMVETEAQSGALVVAVALEYVGPSFPVET